jgi:hypothetical protein
MVGRLRVEAPGVRRTVTDGTTSNQFMVVIIWHKCIVASRKDQVA